MKPEEIEVGKVYKTKNNNWDFRYVARIRELSKWVEFIDEKTGKENIKFIKTGKYEVVFYKAYCTHITCYNKSGELHSKRKSGGKYELCQANYFEMPLEDFAKWARSEVTKDEMVEAKNKFFKTFIENSKF